MKMHRSAEPLLQLINCYLSKHMNACLEQTALESRNQRLFTEKEEDIARPEYILSVRTTLHIVAF